MGEVEDILNSAKSDVQSSSTHACKGTGLPPVGSRELLRSQLPFSPASNAAACRRCVTTICLCAEDAPGVWELGKSARRAVGGPQRSARTRPTDRRQSGRARSQDIRLRGAVRIAVDAYVDGKERAMYPRSRVM